MLHDVVIAGAGPVGLMLACELRLAGTEVVVLEGREAPSPHIPGVAINGGVVELLEMRGIMEACRPHGFEFPMAHFSHVWLDPSRLADRYPYNFALPHARLVQLLAERARSLGAELRFGHRFRDLTQDKDGVEIRIEGPDGEDTARTRYLVGCDGVDSAVRRASGIDFPGHEQPFHGTVADFQVEPEDVLNHHLGAKEYPAGLFAVSPVAPGTVRVLTGLFGVIPPSRDGEPSPAEIQDCVLKVAKVELTGQKPLWSARWFNATRLAEHYRSGQVFLAGDAAHVHFPLGGQALSTGLDDAVNLGWKLAADLAGRASEGLLDTYESERRPVGERACLTAQAQVALLHPLTELREIFTELVRFPDVNEYLVTMVGGTDTRYQLGGDDEPLVGRRIPGVAAAVRAVEGLATAWASGKGVLLDLGDNPTHQGDHPTDRAGNPTDPSDRSTALGNDRAGLGENPAGRYDLSGWSDRVTLIASKPLPGVEAEALLLRPDGRICWVAKGADGPTGHRETTTSLRDALTAWFGTPAATD